MKGSFHTAGRISQSSASTEATAGTPHRGTEHDPDHLSPCHTANMDQHSGGQNSPPSYQWLSFAHQSLTEIPYSTILPQTDTLEVLDLSYNLLDENPALLGRLEKLSTLILDGNNYTSHIKFPYMPSVTTVCVNKNKINNLPVFVEEIRRKLPNLRILSMMNNEAAPSYFNGGSLTQYRDYRQYVISQIPGLEILDDTLVLEKERLQARRTYQLTQSGPSRRKRRDDTSRKNTHTHTYTHTHTHTERKTNAVRRQ
ncbi:leucine-rich melanocyte differentiation-associated protein [Antennarius striatus]|uniref:leucine-rich melanocyte differentiation-associated protein n=1 Tax=Antennarius striatus TaxID=241820 RepID=UPI0035B45EC2